MTVVLVLGGTRSGKSARAEELAAATGMPVRYVATADGADPSLADRIADHVARRPAEWTTVEAGDDLAAAVERAACCAGAGGASGPSAGGAGAGGAGAGGAGAGGARRDAVGAHGDRRATCAPCCLLVDGLGPWIATALHRAGAFDDASDARLAVARDEVTGQVRRVVEALLVLTAAGGAAIVVAEQAGEGVLPPDRASRAWLDLLGTATQRLAEIADRVELIVAGRPLALDDGGVRDLRRSAYRSGRQIDAGLDSDRAALRSRGDTAVRAGAPDVAALRTHGETAVRVGDVDLAELRTHGDTAVRAGDADHAVNVRAEGPPGWLRIAIERALAEDATRYPSEIAACDALAALHGRAPDEVVPANGAAQALWLLPAALRPRLAAVVHPGFTESEAALRAHGVEVVRVLRDPACGFALDPAAVPEAADLVIVGNPASPSGTLDPAAALLALRRPGRTVVVDEAFIDLVPGEPGSLARERLDDVIVVRSLTKSLAIPGLRAGYALAAPPLAERLRAVRPPWSVNALALAALEAVARRPEPLAERAELTRVEQEDLQRRLAEIDGLRAWPSVANYCLVEVADGAAVATALRARRIAVREAASFPGLDARHLRLTARAPDENARLCAALAAAVSELAPHDAAAAAGERAAVGGADRERPAAERSAADAPTEETA
ncbi:bifunctional adenosylcobinamide kinase/adenosylcobinamide-phosphate guanylyltransferase [Conexibacter arvalis]|uniref:Aminotransferase n=1 Tax=Conexibacter arvalis TaxID=912552 RepID=A0A840IHP3_9ACTN|nr:bifunctional adenosylcobinamide kinase/adenosylcobinamide-phosphate guanylyltransferase [Conexibacter arvalis]MBB4663741.1 histidinol-phosphate/aromatic aminotransferase/cobyric acid decarboxylase-like protein/adenosyl cobinamide kinase/adenosyl cobinamide phosphate guanylyltransferase [Conexibacter arvalis]